MVLLARTISLLWRGEFLGRGWEGKTDRMVEVLLLLSGATEEEAEEAALKGEKL